MQKIRRNLKEDNLPSINQYYEMEKKTSFFCQTCKGQLECTYQCRYAQQWDVFEQHSLVHVHSEAFVSLTTTKLTSHCLAYFMDRFELFFR